MSRVEKMNTSDFDYHLPPELIAQEPLPERSAARMMVVHRETGAVEHRHVLDLPQYLDAGDLLVVNNTRVIPARVFGRRTDTGGRVEVLFLEEEGKCVHLASSPCASMWRVLYHASGKPRAGMLLDLANGRVKARIAQVQGQGRLTLEVSSEEPLCDILEKEGFAPLPPYIKRINGRGRITTGNGQRATDKQRYQTVYAKEPGAVAAPTAGLHFDARLINAVAARGVNTVSITLHVGPGTFVPVKTETVAQHVMEAERYTLTDVAAQAVEDARSKGKRVVAVGTTTVRTLETVALEHGRAVAAEGSSSLFIYPPHRFQMVDVLLTNFHLPKSTLLMLVSAFAGRDLILKAYSAAVDAGYRFYSYGDCMLIL